MRSTWPWSANWKWGSRPEKEHGHEVPGGHPGPGAATWQTMDPLHGVANLFDLGLVFIVGLMLALFGAFHLEDLLNPDASLTITKRSRFRGTGDHHQRKEKDRSR
ncbi:MAG: DUF2149 domain-containing protein [Desulfotignum sp.]|nr:DUF2149 domain-containing protein [Desulfotignum sp.]